MDNLDREKLELHEGHEDDFDEDEGVMDENHRCGALSGSRLIRSASALRLRIGFFLV